jgi:prevent-host-death family protein
MSTLNRTEPIMAYTAKDIIPLSQARANLSELVEEVRGGTEKIITKNGESYAALISTEKLEMYYRMERNRIHLLWLQDALTGLQDLKAGRHEDADEYFKRLKARSRAGRNERGGADRE